MLTKKDIINLKVCTVYEREYGTGNKLIFKNRKISHDSTRWFEVRMAQNGKDANYTNLTIDYPTKKNQNGFYVDNGKIIKKYDDNFYIEFE